MSPLAGFIGSAVYVLNPYVASHVNLNPIFLAALCPLVAMPAAIVAAGTGRLSVRWSAAICAANAPLLGYVFLNPPLVGMIMGVTLGTPLLVAWVDGREAAQKGLRALLLAVVLLLALSTYWIVPAVLHLSGFSGGQLANVSSWSFTEVRATVRNAFWLNTVWGWRFPEFYPFAGVYETFPISLLRFVLPALAFGSLALRTMARGAESVGRIETVRRDRELRLAIALATIALTLIILSTGTNPPGNVVFDRLYGLPFGWLLREPGRFLMSAAACYAVLVALTVDVVSNHQSVVVYLRKPTLPRSRGRLAIVPVAFASAVLVGVPIYTGAEVPDNRPGLPTAHITIPTYWANMADFVDSMPVQGSLLLLPPDDFYGMPYSWGYYGADSFIPELFSRHVLVPNPQGYGYLQTSPQLTGAVNLTAQSILRHDWRQTAVLAKALNAPLILVRGDIQSPYPDRQILSPNDLAMALGSAPNFTLVRRSGLLQLFELSDPASDSGAEMSFMTIDTQSPDLRVLSMVPDHTALVSSRPVIGQPAVVQAPPVESWTSVANVLAWTQQAPPGFAYRLAELGSQKVVALDAPGTFTVGASIAQVEYEPGLGNAAVRVSVTGQEAISNGDFRAGRWGPVGDCAAFQPSLAKSTLGASVVPNGAPGGYPALRLSAALDSACEQHPIDWRGGPLVLSLMVNSVRGNPPRICVLESGPERCAAMPPASTYSQGAGVVIPLARGWSTYRASVTPDPGTTALTLYLYADAQEGGSQTIVDYADVRVVELKTLPSFDLIADPVSQALPTVKLAVVRDTFSPQWEESAGGRHVLVNGIVNGWLIPPQSGTSRAFYKPGDLFEAAQWVSLVAWLAVVLVPIGIWLAGRLGIRRLSTWSLFNPLLRRLR
jgi:hypothetical protein